MDSFETASEKTTEHTKDTVDTSVDQAFTASVYARRPSLSLPDSGELAPAAAPAIEQVDGPANKDYGAIVRQRAKKFESAAPRYGSRTAEERRSYQELQDTGAVAQTAQVHKAYIKQHEMQPAPGQFCLDVESDSQERFVYQRNQDLESKERVDEITHSSRSDLSAIEHEAMMIKSSLKSAQTYRSRPNIIPSTLAGPTAANESAASVSKGEHRAQDDLTQILSANIGDSFAAKELSSVENASSVKREQLEPSMTPKTPEPSKQENLAPLALEDTEISEEKSSAAKGSTQATNIHHMIPTKKPILSSPVNKKSASTTSVADHRGQEDLIQIQHTSGTASGIEISIVENSEATEETQFSPSLSESVLVCPAAPNESISLSAATASQELRGQEDLTLHIPSTVCVENEMDKIRKSDELKLLSPSLPTSVRVRPTDPKFKGQENFIAGTQVLNATLKDENEADEGQFGCSSTFPVKAVSKIGSTSTFAVTKHRGQEDRMLRIPAAEISAEACKESGGNDEQFNPPDLLSSIRTNTAEQPSASSSSSSSQTDSDSETDEEASAYGEIPRQVALGQSLISTPLTTISEELPLSNQPKTLQPSESIAIVGRHSDLSKEPTVLISRLLR
ncbi:hypothetical protein BOX15_Mlig006135g2 [Macrostomum lignano]|uniref:Uncharacterized protein n=1 Tax=Macrostomum lignano TaxID=282301 RepID=A0A267DTD3_9PLAT|nr:hypothetical protein BOX15_Mlig006135g2 [Macrostomum lignano]